MLLLLSLALAQDAADHVEPSGDLLSTLGIGGAGAGGGILTLLGILEARRRFGAPRSDDSEELRKLRRLYDGSDEHRRLTRELHEIITATDSDTGARIMDPRPGRRRLESIERRLDRVVELLSEIAHAGRDGGRPGGG